MAWYDDLTTGITKPVTVEPLKPVEVNVTKPGQEYANELKSYNPNIDTSSLDSITTDLSKSITGIDNAGTATINKTSLDNISGLRPDNKYTPYIDQSLSNLKDYASGDSRADRTASNIALSRLDSSIASSTLSQAQKIASNPYLTSGAKQTAQAEMLRTANAERAKVAGDLAQQAQERAFTATQKMADVAQVAANFEEGKFEFDMSKAGEELSRNLQSKIASGQLTAQQATLELQKANEQIGVATQTKQRELDKLKLLVTDETDRYKIDVEKAKLANEQYSYWMGNTANMVMGLWDKNKDLTAADIMNDPATLQSFTIAYQNMPGNEGKTPSELEISTMMQGMKPEWKVAAETYDRNWETTKQALIASGASQTTIDYMQDLTKLTSASGGALSVMPDGSIAVVGADGNPMTYIDEYGKEQQFTFGGSGINGSKIINTLESTLSREQVNTFIDNVNTGKSSGEQEFINMVRNSLPDKQSLVTDEQLTKIYNDIKSGKLTKSEVTSTETEFNESTPWAKENIAILEDPNNENFNKALKLVVDDVLNGYGASNFNNLIVQNPKILENITTIAKTKSVANAKDRSVIQPGDLYYDRITKSILLMTNRKAADGSIVSIELGKDKATEVTTPVTPEKPVGTENVRSF